MKIFSAQLKGTTTVVSGSTASITGSFTGSIAGIDINATNTFTASTIARLSSIETISSSNDSRVNSLEAFSSSIFTTNTFTSSTSARLNSIETISASNIARLTSLESTSASVDTLNTTQNSRLSSLESITGSLATTGSNFFSGSQTITGSLYISADLIVQGSSSLQNITASAVSIGTNIINLNTANPAIRYAGLVIGDSGSIGSSGSFLYDSVQDEMIFVHRGANTTVTSSVVLMGPQTYDSIGGESYPTNNRIQKGTGNEHLVDSSISDDGTTIKLPLNTEVTGSFKVTGNSIIGNTFTIQAGTGLTKHYFTAAGSGDALNQLYDNAGIVKVQLYTNGNSYFNGGKVGIGTVTPQASLHIAAQADTTGLMIGAANGYEIFITGSDSANIYHASPNEAIYLNTNGGPIHLGTSNASTLLTISGSSVGIGTISTSQSLSVYKGGASNYLRIQGDNNSGYDIAQEFSDGTNNVYSGMMRGSTGLTGAYTIWTGGNHRINVLSGGNVGIGITNPTALLQVRGPNATGVFFDAQNDGAGGAAFSRINASSFPFNQYIFNNGNVGINTTSPNYPLHVYKSSGTSAINVESVSGQNSQYRLEEAGVVKFAITYVPSDATTRMYFAGHGTDLITLKGNNVGIGTVSPLATLSTLGGAVQFMGDYQNHQTIIKSAGTAGTLSGQLTIIIPQMSNASTDGYGGYSCEVYFSGFNGQYCHVWFSGYLNGGITPGEVTILRSSGGFSVSQASYGTYNQGFEFIINYPQCIHPTARIIFNKGGSPNATAVPANSITAVFS